MRETSWFKLLGVFWSSFDNTGEHSDYLRSAIGDKRFIRPMMDALEARTLKSFPETITVYRGCGEHNIDGLSWSTERGVAERFPTFNRYRVEKSVLVTATVAFSEIVAFKQDRSENEVITLKPNILRVQPITGIHK